MLGNRGNFLGTPALPSGSCAQDGEASVPRKALSAWKQLDVRFEQPPGKGMSPLGNYFVRLSESVRKVYDG